MPEPGHLSIPLTTEKNINNFKDGSVESVASESTSSAGAGRAEILNYPESEEDVYRARIRFKVFKISPVTFEDGFLPKAQAAIEETSKGLLQAFGTVIREGAEAVIGEPDPTVAEDTTQGGIAGSRVKPEVEGSIKTSEKPGQIFDSIKPFPDPDESIVNMFVPISVTFNDGAQYDDAASLGITGGAAISAMEAGGGVGDAILQGIKDGAMSLIGAGDGRIPSGELARVAATRLTQMAPIVPQGVKNAVSLTTQTALNPNTRPLFRNVNIRTFTFAFKMIPESKREAAVVERIVKHFRKNVYPDVIPEGIDGFSVAYRFPKLFDISFDYGGKRMAIPKIEKCYLRNVAVTYNATSATFHEDGQPNEIDMTLTFVERKTLSRRDIENKGM